MWPFHTNKIRDESENLLMHFLNRNDNFGFAFHKEEIGNFFILYFHFLSFFNNLMEVCYSKFQCLGLIGWSLEI